MRTALLLLINFIFVQQAFTQTYPSVDAIIKREIAERKIPGLQVAIVSKGKIAFNKSYGISNLQDSVPVTEKSIFAINSCTKVFTAVAIMQLVEQGKLNLSAPVSAYLSDLPANWSTVTIKQLLTHTSGLPDELRLLDAKTGGMGSYTETSHHANLQRWYALNLPAQTEVS